MDNRAQAKAFLSSRRARITPAKAELHVVRRTRRVPWPRRGEVADPVE